MVQGWRVWQARVRRALSRSFLSPHLATSSLRRISSPTNLTTITRHGFRTQTTLQSAVSAQVEQSERHFSAQQCESTYFWRIYDVAAIAQYCWRINNFTAITRYCTTCETHTAEISCEFLRSARVGGGQQQLNARAFRKRGTR